MPPVFVQKLVGHWKEEREEGFKAFMEVLDSSFMSRKLEEKTDHKEEWSVNGEDITFKISNALKSETHHFRLGQTFDEKTLDSREMKTTFVEEGDKLIQTSMADQSKESSKYNTTYTRTLEGEFLVLRMAASGTPHPVSATRWYKRVQNK